MKTASLLRTIIAPLFLIVASTLADAQDAAYVRSAAAGPPWDEMTNEQEMDVVFGAGGWSDLRFETVNPATLFSSQYNFVFLEGSDDNADELETFLNTNNSLIESWVNNGGRLFVNAAPNEGDGMTFPFNVTLNFDFDHETDNASAADPSHPIFQGPYTPVATTYTGGAFAHAFVTGTGLTADINGDFGMVLAEARHGSGLVLYGAMTTTNFHDPQPEATNLRENIFYYAAFAGCDSNPPVFSNVHNITVTTRDRKRDCRVVHFHPTANDPEDGPVMVTANPRSGSCFPYGNTTVTLTATDHCGNTSTTTFNVRVKVKKRR